MGAGKYMWFDEMERLMARYVDQGMSEDDAYEKACNNADDAVSDRLAAMADRAKDERKYKDIK